MAGCPSSEALIRCGPAAVKPAVNRSSSLRTGRSSPDGGSSPPERRRCEPFIIPCRRLPEKPGQPLSGGGAGGSASGPALEAKMNGKQFKTNTVLAPKLVRAATRARLRPNRDLARLLQPSCPTENQAGVPASSPAQRKQKKLPQKLLLPIGAAGLIGIRLPIVRG